MSNEGKKSTLEDYNSWEFDHTYTKKELIAKLKNIVEGLEKGKIIVDVSESKKPKETGLEVEIPYDELFCSFEYEIEPMFADEKAKKGYFGVKLFWSDLGIEKLIEEEEMLEDLEDEEDYDLEEDYEENDEN